MRNAWISALCAPLLLASCQGLGPPGGTFVGNPGELAVRLAGDPSDRLVQLTMDTESLRLEDCLGREKIVPIEESLSLLGDATTIALPDGRWCELSLRFKGLFLDLSALGIEPTDLEIELGEIRLVAGEEIAVEGRSFVLELGRGDWVDLVLLGALSGTGVEELLLPELVSEVIDSSLLFLDPDRDGRIDGTERASGPLAAAP